MRIQFTICDLRFTILIPKILVNSWQRIFHPKGTSQFTPRVLPTLWWRMVAQFSILCNKSIVRSASRRRELQILRFVQVDKKIKHYIFSDFPACRQSGFTLIELLVVSGILVAISGIIGGILASTLRGTETTRNNTDVAQGGNYAITTMSEIVKRARAVTGVYDGAPSGPFTDCTGSTPPSGTHMSLEMPDGEVELTCNHNGTNKIASSSASSDYFLTSDTLVVVPGSCRFVCQQASSFSSPRIEIEFELGKDDGSGAVVENTQEYFRTQINVRNFSSQ